MMPSNASLSSVITTQFLRNPLRKSDANSNVVSSLRCQTTVPRQAFLNVTLSCFLTLRMTGSFFLLLFFFFSFFLSLQKCSRRPQTRDTVMLREKELNSLLTPS